MQHRFGYRMTEVVPLYRLAQIMGYGLLDTTMVSIRRTKQDLQQARLRQKASDFKQKYAKRAGIERTISQGVRGFDLHCSHYLGLAKTRLQHLFVAASLNLVRMGAWLLEKPRVQTPCSQFKKLMSSTHVHTNLCSKRPF
jgi:hypothetical protein